MAVNYIIWITLLHLILSSAVIWGKSVQGAANNVTCKLLTAHDSGSHTIPRNYIAVCRNLGLSRVPDNLPNTTVELYLDQNNISRLPSFAFSYMNELKVLDLSESNVWTLYHNCFEGLNFLEELYLAQNYITNPSSIASGVFTPFHQLRVLHVQGGLNGNYTTWLKEIEKLDSLEELGITYFSDVVFPSELARLPNLTNLQLSFGPSTNLLAESLKTLRGRKIRELSFKANKNLAHIDHGAFDDMPELHLLNFACCYNLALDDIIDVLSNTSNTQVTSLIADSTNKGKHGDVIYGAADVEECRSVWHHLTHFSMQECGVQFIHAAAVRCFQNLTALSYGYAQVPLPYPYQEGMEILNDFFEHLLPKSSWQSVRFSYLLRSASERYRRDWGCFYPMLDRPNTDYFPPIMGPQSDNSVFIHNSHGTEEIKISDTTREENIEYEVKQPNNIPLCKDVFFVPRNLQYVEIDNIGLPDRQSYFCVRFTSNNIRVLNMSNNPAFGPEVNGVLYGLDELRVLDVSRSGYRKLNPLLLEYLPSLTHLYASGNSLRQGSFTSIGKARKLQHLDISDNAIPSLNRNIFLGLEELQTINLAKNRLNSTEFVIGLLPFIKLVDLSGNQLQCLDQTARDAIDSRCAEAMADCGLEINLMDNPFSCDCHHLPFTKWIKKTSVNLTKAEMLKCTDQHDQVQTINSIDISDMERYCNVMAHLPLIASISATVALVVLVAAPLAYRFRWHLKWYLYRLKFLRKKHRYTPRAEEAQFRDAFVIYAFENNDDRRWVIETLRIKLEQENNYNLWLEGRNDIPGRFRVDNLMDMLRRSRTVIWILSQAFLQDIMCLEMAHQAYIHLGHKKNLVVRRAEVAEGIDAELARRDIGQILEVLHPRFGIRVAEYAPENIMSETLFWEQVRKFIDKNVPSVHGGEWIALQQDGHDTGGTLYEHA